MKIFEITEQNDLDNLIKTGVQGSYKMLAKYIAGIEELIAKNPNHPKSKKYGPMLPKLKADLAKSKQDAGLGETATAGGTGAASIAVSPIAMGGAMQQRNPNGTAKNALDSDTNLLGSKKKSKKNKKD